MTLSGTTQPLPDAGPLNESPNASGIDLAELGLPQPAFRRRSHASSGRSSNRSSTHSLVGLTSEELWQLDQPDLSNPMRSSAETPLITARRNSRIGRSPSSQGYISPEVICKLCHASISLSLTVCRAICYTRRTVARAQIKIYHERRVRRQEADYHPQTGISQSSR